MTVQSLSASSSFDPVHEHPKLILKRKDVGTCPLGTVGNLQFSAEQGGTVRARPVGVALSNMRLAVSGFWADLAYSLTCKSEHEQQERDYLAQARNNSRYVGNLLGSLTASQSDYAALSGIVRRLTQLAELSKGDLGNLKGGRESLSFYMDELKDSDIEALRLGVLGSWAGTEKVLIQISSNVNDPLLKYSAQVLDQFGKALGNRLDQADRAALAQAVKRLSAAQSDGQTLRTTLPSLCSLTDVAALHHLLLLLSNGQAGPQPNLEQQEKSAECSTARTEEATDEGEHGLEMLNSLHEELWLVLEEADS